MRRRKYIYEISQPMHILKTFSGRLQNAMFEDFQNEIFDSLLLKTDWSFDIHSIS